MEYLYRYYDRSYVSFGGISIDGDALPGRPITKVELEKYKVIKYTPKGVWIALEDYIPYDDEITQDKQYTKFVLLTAKKKFACPTIEEALESFKARKKRQIKILNEQLDRAKRALEISEKINHKGSELSEVGPK